MFFNTSKIQFESKSQLIAKKLFYKLGCFSIRQRYNLKANHNYGFCLVFNFIVVFQYVKDTIWKQITTLSLRSAFACWLFFNTSKIQFESKSQPSFKFSDTNKSCFSIRQRYNLKANHNRWSRRTSKPCVVFQYVKDTIWKQITTEHSKVLKDFGLFFNTSKIQFESKSQPNGFDLAEFVSCFSIRQRYNLKANHNPL